MTTFYYIVNYKFIEILINETNDGLMYVVKVGIVGNGKSSLLAALLRLEEPSGGGCVLIDNVDTRNVPIKLLRSKISVIPRHPTFFAGALRSNLDPHNQLNDSQLWQAIHKVRICLCCKHQIYVSVVYF